MRTFTSLSTKVYYINVGIVLFISSQLYYSMVLYIFVVSKYESVSNYEKKVWTVINVIVIKQYSLWELYKLYKQTCNKEHIKSTFSSKYVKSPLSSVLMTFFLKRNPVYLLEMVLMDLKYMKVFLILISY